MTSPTADEPTTSIAAGATVTGVVNTNGDVDAFTINLVAGQTYSFSLAGSGSDPLIDPILSLTRNGVEVGNDDDGGIGIDSLLTFTATTTGTYQITAAAYPDSGLTGEYTLAVRQMGQDSVGSNRSSATPIATDTLTYGFVETSGDVDTYSVTLVEGMYYSFDLAGGTDYNTPAGVIPQGELDTRIAVYDSAGNQIAENNNLSSSDLNSGVGFIAAESGTYYVQVAAGSGQTGGYTLDVEGIDLTLADPLDSIDWGTQLPSTTVTVYFATQGQTFDGVTSLGWTTYEINQAMAALRTFAEFSDLTFSRTMDPGAATFRLVTTHSEEFLGYFNPPGETNAGVGVFATNYAGWNTNGGLTPGGAAFATLVHEFGHGLGLSHPHDNGGGSAVMPGVGSSFASYGVFDLNQGIYTTMSYNDGWQLHPNGTSGSANYGFQGGPGALDIALIQLKYGVSSHNTGDNVYTLPTANAVGTFWDVIWDTGGIDTIAHSGTVSAQIDLTAATLDYSATGGGVVSYVNGIFGGLTIAGGVVIENATGGAGADVIIGNDVANVLTGGGGADSLVGRGGADTFRGAAAQLNGDSISDFGAGDRILITDANLASFSFSFSGSTLTYSGGSLTLANGVVGQLVASAAAEGGVQLTLSAAPPPPPPPSPASRAKLLLTESGQDFEIGGNVTVIGTTRGGEELRVVGGNILLDASFNRGGDTIVLPGAAGSYSATLSGSFVTLTNGDVSISIPVGTAGLTVEFGDAERTLAIDSGSGQVMLGGQAISATTAWVAASTAPFESDGPGSGPASLARLILTEPGQDVDIGGNVAIVGTSAGGEVMTILGGNVRLDASFNRGGDTVVLPGEAGSYTATLSGSFVTIAGGDISVAIPVGAAGLTVEFGDAEHTLRVDSATGQVMLGDQVVTSGGGSVQAAAHSNTAMLDDAKDADADYGLTLDDLAGSAELAFAAVEQGWAVEADFDLSVRLQRLDFNDSFSIG